MTRLLTQLHDPGETHLRHEAGVVQEALLPVAGPDHAAHVAHHELHRHPLEGGGLVHVAQHEVAHAVPDLQRGAQPLLADALQQLQLVLLGRGQQLVRQPGEGCGVELETKAKRRFAKISQSPRRSLLGPSPG